MQDDITCEYRFDIHLLAYRLAVVADWIKHQSQFSHLGINYFGASTGGGAALVAAAHRPDMINSIVSRGGRPDLAADSLRFVKAPTLLIVGGDDREVIEMNKNAMREMNCVNQLTIVPGATHLFEEPGALDQVAHLAMTWFMRFNPQ